VITVAELIEKLSSLPKDLPVLADSEPDGEGRDLPVADVQLSKIGGWGSCVKISTRLWNG
jgi:hypothetical protein